MEKECCIDVVSIRIQHNRNEVKIHRGCDIQEITEKKRQPQIEAKKLAKLCERGETDAARMNRQVAALNSNKQLKSSLTFSSHRASSSRTFGASSFSARHSR